MVETRAQRRARHAAAGPQVPPVQPQGQPQPPVQPQGQPPQPQAQLPPQHFLLNNGTVITNGAANQAGVVITPVEQNQITINTVDWQGVAKPWNIRKRDWAPQTADPLLTVTGEKIDCGYDCLGPNWGENLNGNAQCDSNLPDDQAEGRKKRKKKDKGTPECDHTFDHWINHGPNGRNWQDYVELILTQHRGVGARARRNINEADVLGAYTGELVPEGQRQNSDYRMEIPIGPDRQRKIKHKLKVAWIDAERAGSWTRFINHSHNSNTQFQKYRVGSTFVLAVVACKGIAAGEEITVDYNVDDDERLIAYPEGGCRCSECEDARQRDADEAAGKAPAKKRRGRPRKDENAKASGAKVKGSKVVKRTRGRPPKKK